MDRKEFLKSIGLLTAGAAILPSQGTLKAAERLSGANGEAMASMATDAELDFPVKSLKANINGLLTKCIQKSQI